MNKVKSGKMPATTSTSSNSDFLGLNLYDSELSIHPKVKEYLTSKDLVPRFLNKKEYISAGNHHRSGWKAFIVPEADRGTLQEFCGISPEGTIVVRDLVLGVKTKESQGKHKARLEQQNQILKRSSGAEDDAS